MGLRDTLDRLRDVKDVLSRSRGVREMAEALLPPLRSRRVLNLDAAPSPEIDASVALGRAARQVEAQVLDGRVNYAGVVLSELETTAASLRALDPKDVAERAERESLLINVYNALSIHGVVALGIRASVMEVPAFFDVVAYRIGGHDLSLNAIEHGLLRANAPHFVTGRPTLDADHPALRFALPSVDPRVHCALVCASTSCPPIAFYEAEELDAQLDLASAVFVNASTRVEEGVVRTSRIFAWYERDFAPGGGVRAFLRRHADEPLRAQLEDAHELAYDRYDWSLNRA